MWTGLTIGGKITLQALSKSSPFCCGAIVHPAMIAPEDGENLAVPLGFYPSKDEPKDVVDQIKASNEKKFGDKGDFKLYDTV